MSESFVLANKYHYFVLQLPVTSLNVKSVAGNYGFFIRENRGFAGISTYKPVYLGITTNFAERLPCHDRWIEAVRLGANTIAAHVNPDANARCAEERELIALCRPALNTHYQPAGLGALASALLTR